MPVYFNRLKLYFRFIYLFFLVHLHLLFSKIGWCRFYVQVKILQRTKLPVEWLICWGSFNKLYLLLPLHQRGHPCSLNSSLRYNPSFHLSCFWIGGFFIVPLWEVASSGHRNFSSILVSVFVMPSLGCQCHCSWYGKLLHQFLFHIALVGMFCFWRSSCVRLVCFDHPFFYKLYLHNLLCGLLLRQCFWLVESKGEE